MGKYKKTWDNDGKIMGKWWEHWLWTRPDTIIIYHIYICLFQSSCFALNMLYMGTIHHFWAHRSLFHYSRKTVVRTADPSEFAAGNPPQIHVRVFCSSSRYIYIYIYSYNILPNKMPSSYSFQFVFTNYGPHGLSHQHLRNHHYSLWHGWMSSLHSFVLPTLLRCMSSPSLHFSGYRLHVTLFAGLYFLCWSYPVNVPPRCLHFVEIFITADERTLKPPVNMSRTPCSPTTDKAVFINFNHNHRSPYCKRVKE